MVVVSADARAPNKPAAKPGEGGGATPGDAAKSSQASGAPSGAAPGSSQTITIIDGMSGKRQEVAIAVADPKGQTPAIEQRLTETSRHGSIPRIAPDGARPADIYARPLQPSFDKVAGPRIAIVVGGLGIGGAGTFEALAKLPPPVTLAFAPYGTDLARWVGAPAAKGTKCCCRFRWNRSTTPTTIPGRKPCSPRFRSRRTSTGCIGS
jgi:uncharacterized protein